MNISKELVDRILWASPNLEKSCGISIGYMDNDISLLKGNDDFVVVCPDGRGEAGYLIEGQKIEGEEEKESECVIGFNLEDEPRDWDYDELEKTTEKLENFLEDFHSLLESVTVVDSIREADRIWAYLEDDIDKVEKEETVAKWGEIAEKARRLEQVARDRIAQLNKQGIAH